MKDGTTATSPHPDDHPGFWKVPLGLLIEPGDQYVDRQGMLHTLPLEQVGRPVAGNLVVLRAERRHTAR